MAKDTIKDNSTIILEDIRLSNNPDSRLVDSPEGINGKINVTEDGRQFYMAMFTDPQNPFSAAYSRMISQSTDSQGNPVWKSQRMKPVNIKKFVGTEIPGEIVTKSVDEYEIGDNTVSIYTTVILKGESISTVFASNDHQLLDSDDDYTVIKGVDKEDAPTVTLPNTPVTETVVEENVVQ